MPQGAVDVSDFEDFLKGQQPDVSDFDDFLKKEKSAPVDVALKTVPRPAAPKMDTVDVLSGKPLAPTSKLVQTSPYSPGAVPTFEPMGDQGGPKAAETAAATTAAATAGTEQAFGVPGYKEIGHALDPTLRPGEMEHPVRGGFKRATEVIQGAGQAATPVFAEAAGSAPLTMAKGLATGAAASYVAGKGAEALNAPPEVHDFLKELAFWAGPALAARAAAAAGLEGFAIPPEDGKSAAGIKAFGGKVGAQAAVTPDEIRIAGKVGPFSGEKVIPRGPAAQPGIEPPTIEGQVPPPAQPPAVDEAASGMVQAKAAEARAGRVASGLPPDPPQPQPAPPPAPNFGDGITPAQVEALTQIIEKAPDTEKPTLALQTHEVLARWLLSKGQVVGPDGQIATAKNPEEAAKIAQGWINDAVAARDKEQISSKSAGEKSSAVENSPENHVVDDDLVAQLQSEHEATTNAGESRENASGTRSAGSGELAPASAATGTEPRAPDQSVKRSEVATPANNGGATYAKGDTVTLKSDLVRGDKTYKAGTQAEVTWASAPTGGDNRQPILRIKTADGNKISLGPSQIQKGSNALRESLAKLEDKPAAKNLTKVVSNGDTYEYTGGQLLKNGKVLDKGSDIADAIDALDPRNAIEGVGRIVESEAREKGSHEAPVLSPTANPPAKVEAVSPAASPQPVVAGTPARTQEGESEAVRGNRENLGLPPRVGEVGKMRTSALHLDPKRFQYKLSTDAEGVGTLLKNTKVFNPDLAGQISVWKDPSSGKTFVVNGHHRFELAKRTGTKSIVVRHLKADNAGEARSIGARQNIAEGRGTPLDAAKFLRDANLTPADLERHGISLGEKTASDGVALSHLDTPIFNKVVSGDLRQGRAVAIGEATSDPAEQKAILSLVEKKEAKGGKVNDETLRELIRLVKSSGQTTETTADLFGVQQINRSLAIEKAEISAHIKGQLAKDKKLFGFVAKESRAQELERAGNKIDVEKSKEISTGAAQAEEVYNKLSSRGGPIQTILDESAQRLADGDNVAAVKSEAYQRVRAEVSKTLRGSEGSVSQGLEKGTGGPETPEGGSGEPEGSINLFHVPDVPTFYSKAEKVATEKVPNSASGDAVLATLKNNGVKADEMKWMGLDDLAGKPKVSKAELLERIRENSLQIKDVTKSDPQYLKRDGQVVSDGAGGLVENRGATKYQQYTLPGEKKNYSELLMTLPSGHRIGPDVEAEHGRLSATGNRTPEQESRHRELTDYLRKSKTGEVFRSSHFDEPNILAHVRFDERTDADGKRVLLVEEVQSDWHQKGKKFGYAQTGIEDQVKAAQKEIDIKQADMARKYKELTGYNGTTNNGPEQHEALTNAYRNHNDEEAGRIIDALDRAVFHWQDLESKSRSSAVPDAPFKSDWHELAMKRMLREAAEQGYDKLAWVTGQQTADRYDLSKTIQSIGYYPHDIDHQEYVLSAVTSDGRHIDLGTKKTAELSDVVGKDIASRIVNGEGEKTGHGTVLSGLELKQGGEWAKNLYDRAIPNFLSKYGKKWGVKVAETRIRLGEDEKAYRDAERTGDSTKIAEALGGQAKVHAIDVTPEMKKSVMEEGQPLFRPAEGPILPGTAKKIEVEFRPTEEGLPGYLRVNRAGLSVLSRLLRANFLGVSLGPSQALRTVRKLEDEANTLEGKGHKDGAGKLRTMARLIAEHNHPHDGTIVVAAMEDPKEELRILHEELLHAAGQQRPGKGQAAYGVPWRQTIGEPAFAKMATERIVPRMMAAGLDPDVVSVVAEGIVDLMKGEAPEITPAQADAAAGKYFEALADASGIEALQPWVQAQAYLAKREAEYNVAHNRDDYAVRKAATDRLNSIYESRRGKETPSGRSEIQKGSQAGGPSGNPSTNAEDAGSGPIEGEGRAAPAKGTPPGEGNLHSTANVGLNDEELESWAKNKAFRVEPAGEQLGMFGDHDKVFRVFRTVGKNVQTGLVYENQLDRAGISKEGPQQTSLGLSVDENAPKPWESDGQSSLFRGESGTFEPGKVGEAGSAVKNFLKESAKNISTSRELQSGMYGLESQYSADVLRAVQTMKDVVKDLGGKKEAQRDLEAIYHHLENPEEPLTPAQDKVLDDTILPLMDESDRIFRKLTQGGVPAENYVHRVVKGKGGFLDRIARGGKGSGRGNLLSKSAPQTKHRTMFAIEDSDGNRRVVSLKGGQVTAWDHGSPENLGPIMHTEEGKAFEDKDGKLWTLTQATTKEIEKSTELEYYHNALASALTSYLQLRKAERGFDFIESFKSDPDFKNIAVEAGKGNPPDGWKATDLPQLKGYFFEPHTAEVLDWYNKKLKTEGPGLMDRVGSFMRTAMLLNPLMHPANIAASWTMEKGVIGLLPHRWIKTGKAGVKALKAVTTQNHDFLEALDAGAPLQSQRETTRQLSKLFFDQLATAVDKGEPWALRVAKSIGFPPVTLVNTLHTLAGKAAWLSNDIFFLQSAFEKVADGMTMKDALRETGRVIPEYRPPVRIFNSKTLGTLMTNKWATIFGAYHYSLLKSFGEMGKSMFGMHEPPPGESRAGDVAHGWSMFALLGLLAFGLYPALDDLAKKMTGDEKARVRRFGPLGVIDNIMQVAHKEKSPTQALQSVVTPAPVTKSAIEMAANRDLYSGHQIYDPQADWKTIAEQVGHYLASNGTGTIGQGLDAAQSESKWKKFKYGQVGVTFPHSGAEKIAQNIASAKSDTKAWTAEERTKYYQKQDALEALRKGDTKPFEKLQAGHVISHTEAHLLQKRAKLTWLQDKVHNFTYSETMEVYKAATPEQKKELDPILREKRMNLIKKGRKAELEEVH